MNNELIKNFRDYCKFLSSDDEKVVEAAEKGFACGYRSALHHISQDFKERINELGKQNEESNG